MALNTTMNIHAVSYSLPHRAPAAPRARARWQPYASSLTSRSPSICLPTPASSISSASPQATHPPSICYNELPKASLQHPPIASTLRDHFRANYAAKLVDRAVNTLTETWHPDNIPTVFTAGGGEALCAQSEPLSTLVGIAKPSLISNGLHTVFADDNTQLPSPITPNSRPTPVLTGSESYSQTPRSSVGCNLIPMRGFVHEVLRRSRTSTGVLQTALCYLEAIRPKVPELLHREKVRPTSECFPLAEPLEPRIVQGVFQETFDASDASVETVKIGDTVLVADIDVDNAPPSVTTSRCQYQSAVPPHPHLPSPLCCPRRTFLACLILASKFMQDRSYSNRAWAKLAGLPPREIGRCERAVGEALEWRLWVGKLPPSATSGTNATRIIGRTRSDGDVLYDSKPTCTPSPTAEWASASAAPVASSSDHTFLKTPPPIPASRVGSRGISRSATVPAISADRSSTLVDPSVSTSAAAEFYYESRETSRSDYGHTSRMDVVSQFEISPPLSTPSLTYSPMSCMSSSSDGSEDRTVSLSTFMDFPTPAMSTHSGPWVTNVSSYIPSDPANPCGPYGSIEPYGTNLTYVADTDIAKVASKPLDMNNWNVMKQIHPVLPSFAEVFSNSGARGNGTF